jgi:ribosomal protein L28
MFPWRRIPGDQLSYNRSFHVNKQPTTFSLDKNKKQKIYMVTAALRVIGGDKKGSLESETVKYGSESHGACTAEDQQQL